MRRLMMAVLLVSAACTSFDGGTPPPITDGDAADAGSPTDAGIRTDSEVPTEAGATDAALEASTDAARLACDPSAAFGAPLLLAGINSGSSETAATLSDDELSIYFTRGTEGANDFKLMKSTRTSLSASFDAPVPAPQANNNGQEELGVVFIPTGGVIVARRVNVDISMWLETGAGSKKLPCTAACYHPNLAPDGTLYFAYDLVPPTAMYRMTDLTSATPKVAPVPLINGASRVVAPVMASDGLTLYYGNNARGDFDVWVSHRPTATVEFPVGSVVAELSGTGANLTSWLTKDNCRLYFASNRAGSYDIYVAERPARVPSGGD